LITDNKYKVLTQSNFFIRRMGKLVGPRANLVSIYHWFYRSYLSVSVAREHFLRLNTHFDSYANEYFQHSKYPQCVSLSFLWWLSFSNNHVTASEAKLKLIENIIHHHSYFRSFQHCLDRNSKLFCCLCCWNCKRFLAHFQNISVSSCDHFFSTAD
jgi:hypothetical protein